MNRAEALRAVRDRLESILRRHSGRPVVVDAPLGPEGHGLDSLSLVEFAVGLEESAGLRLPEEWWGSLAARTPDDFVRLLAGE